MIKLTQPQELEAYYILPALRRELAQAMVKRGIEQKEIANKLCVTEAAVSQYISGKRGTGIKFDKNMQKMIEDSANKITTPAHLTKNIQELMSHMRQKKVICTICQDHNSHLSKNCKVCFK